MLLRFLLLYFVVDSSSFPIRILNSELLLQRQSGPLFAEIDLKSVSAIESLNDLIGASVAMAVDGEVCKTYTEPIAEIQFELTPQCLRSESFTFSLVVQLSSGLVLTSTPFHVPKQDITMVDKTEGGMIDAALFSDKDETRITLVLPLLLNDIPRSFILIESLKALDNTVVKEMLVFTPTKELEAVESLLTGPLQGLSFPATVHADAELLGNADTTGAYPYAIQMSLKLLVHRLVSTSFYLTLDADVILLRSFKLSDIVDSDGRVLYHHENRSETHSWWWDGSEAFLGLPSRPSSQQSAEGFSVTPAFLSTLGVELVFEMIKNAAHVAGHDQDPVGWWVRGFGRSGVVWSEYTLYATVLHHHQVLLSLVI